MRSYMEVKLGESCEGYVCYIGVFSETDEGIETDALN